MTGRPVAIKLDIRSLCGKEVCQRDEEVHPRSLNLKRSAFKINLKSRGRLPSHCVEVTGCCGLFAMERPFVERILELTDDVAILCLPSIISLTTMVDSAIIGEYGRLE